MKNSLRSFALLVLVAFNFVQAEEDLMAIRKPEMTIVGIACRTSNETAMQDIPAHWAKFFSDQVASQVPHKLSDEIFALYCDYEGDYTQPYTLVIGYNTSGVDEIPKGLVAKVIPASNYAQFTATGAFPESVIQTWGKIWQSNLARTYTGDFEIYGEAFKGPDKQVDICISIQE